jgi:hypothetical protein
MNKISVTTGEEKKEEKREEDEMKGNGILKNK